MKNLATHKKKKNFVVLSEALKYHPKSEILKRALEKHKVINAWPQVVPAFFEDAAEKSQAVDFQEGVLYVACLSKELAAKIQMFAGGIIYLINQLIGETLVCLLKVEF